LSSIIFASGAFVSPMADIPSGIDFALVPITPCDRAGMSYGARVRDLEGFLRLFFTTRHWRAGATPTRVMSSRRPPT
jgi:hypothetical protein